VTPPDWSLLPIVVGDLDLDAPLPDAVGVGKSARSARLLVRLHGTPVGEVSIDLRAGPVGPEQLADAVERTLGAAISAHLAADGEVALTRVPAAGLPTVDRAPCAHLRLRAMSLPIRVTVVIATHDRTQSLLRCLRSIARSDHPAFDVVVVDSAPSNDDTARALVGPRPWPFALHYVQCELPGLARAHNAALPYVTGEVVAFTDDDVIVDRHWVSSLAGAFDDPSVDCVTGLILPAELDTVAQLRIEQAGGFARGFERRVLNLGNPPEDPLFPFTAGRLGSGANMAFRAAWLQQVGGFDPATGAGTIARGGDDLLAFLRVLLEDRTLVYEPAAVVRHRHHRDEAQLRRQAYGYGVGLGSYLTAAAWSDPSVLKTMVRRSRPALHHLLARNSAKNAGIPADYPRELVWRERLGVLAGPIAYARSRRAVGAGG
jgi:GT2 family glycosyltransferase